MVRRGVSHRFLAQPCGLNGWAHLGSNQGPLACEASALPLSYAPGREMKASGLGADGCRLQAGCQAPTRAPTRSRAEAARRCRPPRCRRHRPRAADHEVRVHGRVVVAERCELLGGRALVARDGGGDALPVGDVAGGVLVEERVEEDDPRLADPGLAVDECDLAEVRRALVGAHLLPHDIRAARCGHVGHAPALESHREIGHDLAVHGQGHRRADDALGAKPMRGREHLLGTACSRPRRHRSPCARHPSASATPASAPTVRSVPAPRKRIASKRRSSSSAARSCSRAMCARHAATGSLSSSRVATATASHSRSTSGSPNTACAQPGFG